MINTILRRTPILFALFALSSCGNGSPVAATPPPAATLVSLVGTVTTQDGARLSGATVRINDSVNAGRVTTTNDDGEYRFDGLGVSNGNVGAVADGYDAMVKGIYIDGSKPLNFTLRTTAPWRQVGTGNAEFDMPGYITRVHIIGAYTGVKSYFTVHIGGCAIVDDSLGTSQIRTVSDGTYLVTPAGTPTPAPPSRRVEIRDSAGVSWSITEERNSSDGTPCYLY